MAMCRNGLWLTWEVTSARALVDLGGLRWGEQDSSAINPERPGLCESYSGFGGCAFHPGEQILEGSSWNTRFGLAVELRRLG